MRSNQVIFLLAAFILPFIAACTDNNEEPSPALNKYLDTLVVPHEMKGYELYSWHEGNYWYFSVMVGTNRIKTYEEVIASNPSSVHLITVTGLDTLRLVLNKFPENENITWLGKEWLESSWGGNSGNLQLPPLNYIDEIISFCKQKKLNLQVTD